MDTTFTILIGLAIFLARVADVSLGTMRTISIIHGRTKTAFFLGFFEVSIWLTVMATVITMIARQPILGVFYALGFSTGNVVGIHLERRIAFGHVVLRVISPRHAGLMAEKLRMSGYAVTTFQGEGISGPVMLLYVVCRRKELKETLAIVQAIQPDAFYLVEQAGMVSRLFHPTSQEATGWRAALKMK